MSASTLDAPRRAFPVDLTLVGGLLGIAALTALAVVLVYQLAAAYLEVVITR